MKNILKISAAAFSILLGSCIKDVTPTEIATEDQVTLETLVGGIPAALVVASDRLDQMQDPEMSIEQAMADYKRLGYSDNWINQRLKSMEVRKELTDEWQRRGVEGQQFATLTDIITQAWADRTTKAYKQFKGLKKENLRDNMTNIELALNTLAEASVTEISKQRRPKGFQQNVKVARSGGSVAKAARTQLEKQLGHSVVSPINAAQVLAAKEAEQIEGEKDKD